MYLRIACARASRRFPVLFEMLGDGRLHLNGIAKLAPHLTEENAAALFERAEHKSKREIEELCAAVAPRPDVPSSLGPDPCCHHHPLPHGRRNAAASPARCVAFAAA